MSTNDVSSKSGLAWGHSTSLKMASFKFNGSYFASYQSAILTIALNRTIFTIFDIGEYCDHEFMHDLYIVEIYRPGAVFFCK